ncbi:putative histidine kinase [Blattamonas nauphoetae]|uniref:histidine kinase n=1 Tax=Blattamonas nauphoetae TaxID=2049346 RepID=A0ABQ9XYD3_9EUKA|nr:putative histidine kinase [Blattamonas nauphoetae]
MESETPIIVEDGPIGTGDEDAMDTLEITHDLQLTDEQKAKLVFHSFSNLMTVLMNVIGKCRAGINDETKPIFTETLSFVTNLGKSLTSLTTATTLLSSVPELQPTIDREISEARNVYNSLVARNVIHPNSNKLGSLFERNLNWLEKDLLPNVTLRAKEIMQRLSLPNNAWVMFKIDSLRHNLEQNLLAVARGSSHISGIVFSEAERRKSGEMCVLLDFKGVLPGSIHLPPVYQDILRDLVMNARKYSLPGSTIHASLLNDGTTLTVRVQDNGMGIPLDELEALVQFGQRGSNVESRRTLGGGFGLTKAYYFTKQFNGTFKVQTAIGVGTIFTLTIPCPKMFKLVMPCDNKVKHQQIEKKLRDTITISESAIFPHCAGKSKPMKKIKT